MFLFYWFLCCAKAFLSLIWSYIFACVFISITIGGKSREKKKILLQFLSKSVLLIGSYHTFSSLIHLSVFLCMVLESVQFSSVHLLSSVQLFVTPWTAACQASLTITNSQSLTKLMFIELVMPSNHLILCHPLLFPPSIFHSIRAFSNESVLHIRWPKYWSFSFNICPSNEHLGLIFRMDWLDILAAQGTLKSLLQHHSPKASNWCSVFFIVQISHPYMTTGKTIALTSWTLLTK